MDEMETYKRKEFHSEAVNSGADQGSPRASDVDSVGPAAFGECPSEEWVSMCDSTCPVNVRSFFF